MKCAICGKKATSDDPTATIRNTVTRKSMTRTEHLACKPAGLLVERLLRDFRAIE